MSANQPPTMTAPPRIQLTTMPQLAEATTHRDNWTGTTSAAARRRAQTRLNTRAYRKRKAQQATLTQNKSSVALEGPVGTARELTTRPETELRAPYWDNTNQIISALPVSHLAKIYDPRAPLLHSNRPPGPNTAANRTEPRANPNYYPNSNTNIIFPLSPDHLITLLQFNALRALAVNRTLLSGILTTPLDCDIEVTHIIPYPSPERVSLIPPSLLPTRLQQTIPHPDWIDLFPLPEGRDSLILGSLAGSFDEDELWSDCIGGLYEGYPDDEMERRGLIAWGPPWDVKGWEMSEGFVNKWGARLFGEYLGEVLEATNRWRAIRGDEVIVYKGEIEEVI
ncbi:protein of unknown function (DUF3425) domain containing protein [Naviculisporaceae sp. PSN 640]